jgi:propanol-preferring alcohol dehydrogenase
MKAALLRDFGAPLAIDDVPVPVPGPGQVLVRVAACGACHSDVHLWQGEWEGFKARMPKPLIMGHEVAGIVAQTGPGVSGLKEGDPVGIPWFHFTCGQCEYCRTAREVFCENSQITGVTVHGGFAEFIVAWESHVIPIPRSLSLSAVAPLLCAGGTVFSALAKVKLDADTHVGVWGAGGLGHYGIQLAKRAGARVTVVDLVFEKLTSAKRLGADVAVTAPEAAEWFSDSSHRVDVALVCATAVEAYQAAFHALKKNGVMLVVGIPSKPLSWMAGDLIRSGVRIIPSRVASRAELRELMLIAAAGEIHSEVREHPLEDINEVMQRLAEGRIFGRSVITFGVK